jgi:ribosomal protein S6E (S10)
MNRILLAGVLAIVSLSGCGSKNNYEVKITVLRQNQQPAVGFKVDAHVTGRSEPATKLTDEKGIAHFDDLPAPDKSHPLVSVVHYYRGQNDGEREITYPFIESDAKRLKDTQYIPNDSTPDPS